MAFGDRYADDCTVDDRKVGKKDGFDLRVDHVPATDFDEVLRTINDLYIPVPEVYNVSGPPETPSSSNMSAVTEERSR